VEAVVVVVVVVLFIEISARRPPIFLIGGQIAYYSSLSISLQYISLKNLAAIDTLS
jgi:hypothetical protein